MCGSFLNKYVITGIHVKYCMVIGEMTTPFNQDKVLQLMFHLGRRWKVVCTFILLWLVTNCPTAEKNWQSTWIVSKLFFIQLPPDGLKIFEAVRQQVNVPDDYSAEQLKSDMIVYLQKNREYFRVIWFMVEMMISCNTSMKVALFICYCYRTQKSALIFIFAVGFVRDKSRSSWVGLWYVPWEGEQLQLSRIQFEYDHTLQDAQGCHTHAAPWLFVAQLSGHKCEGGFGRLGLRWDKNNKFHRYVSP